MIRNRKGNKVWRKCYSAFFLWTECEKCHKEFRWEYMYSKVLFGRTGGSYILCKHCITKDELNERE
jgi:hypothetical protein